MEKILVTTDGSDTANKALLEAKRLGTAFGAEDMYLDCNTRCIDDSLCYHDQLQYGDHKEPKRIWRKNPR